MRWERGSVTLVAAVLVGLMTVLAVGLGAFARIVAAREIAQTAADAAALGAAPVTFRPFGGDPDPGEVAARLASGNGGQLVRCTGCVVDLTWRRRVVEVAVRVEADLPGPGRIDVTALAAAEFLPVQLLGLP